MPRDDSRSGGEDAERQHAPLLEVVAHRGAGRQERETRSELLRMRRSARALQSAILETAHATSEALGQEHLPVLVGIRQSEEATRWSAVSTESSLCVRILQNSPGGIDEEPGAEQVFDIARVKEFAREDGAEQVGSDLESANPRE